MKFKIYNTAKNNFSIDIDGVIGNFDSNEFSFATFKNLLESISQTENPIISVNIRSTGGDVNEAILIYDALMQVPNAQITTTCYGYVASAATIIAQAASEGKREISSNALYLVHKSSCAMQGNSNNLNQLVELLDKTDQSIASIYASRSGKPIEDFIALMNQNNGDGMWLTPSEALAVGLVDQIKSFENNTTNSSSQIMNITKPFTAILSALGLNSNEQKIAIDEKSLEMIENKITSDGELIEQMSGKIVTLEAENQRLNAMATTLTQVEDPSSKSMTLSANQQAYNADIANFK